MMVQDESEEVVNVIAELKNKSVEFRTEWMGEKAKVLMQKG